MQEPDKPAGVSSLDFLSAVALTLLIGASSMTARAEEIRPGVLRTPDERFENLQDFPFEPNYVEIDGYRIHYLDEGPADAPIVFLLHGEPTWSYLYRKMIPVFVDAGYRCIAPDLVGFGRSDKPAERDLITYKFQVDAMAGLVQALDLRDMTFFGQDWGGLVGLRVVAENPDRFARVVISNTGLPTGEGPLSPAFMQWKAVNQQMNDVGEIKVGNMMQIALRQPGNEAIKTAYNAPFPDTRYKAAPLIMPQRVPVSTDDSAREANLAAWEIFRQWEKPFLTAFGDSDPVTGGMDRKFQEEVPGAQGQPHTIVAGAGHFIQESHGPELARIIIDFMEANPLP